MGHPVGWPDFCPAKGIESSLLLHVVFIKYPAGETHFSMAVGGTKIYKSIDNCNVFGGSIYLEIDM
jgi:hypothetical protein